MSVFRQFRLSGAIAPAKTIPVKIILVATMCVSCWYSTPARAQPRSLNLVVSSEGMPSFARLMQQAESQTSKLIQQEFERKPKVTEITVTVVGDRNGQQVPLLHTQVSRVDWRSQPVLSHWTRYFSNSALLLSFSSSPNGTATDSQRTPANVNTARRLKEDDPAYRDD